MHFWVIISHHRWHYKALNYNLPRSAMLSRNTVWDVFCYYYEMAFTNTKKNVEDRNPSMHISKGTLGLHSHMWQLGDLVEPMFGSPFWNTLKWPDFQQLLTTQPLKIRPSELDLALICGQYKNLIFFQHPGLIWTGGILSSSCIFHTVSFAVPAL